MRVIQAMANLFTLFEVDAKRGYCVRLKAVVE